MPFIAVIGGSECPPDVYEMAEVVGYELARRGAILVCGGLFGVMEAACKGAKRGGGTTVGILPGDKRSDANSYVDIPIVTGIGYARNIVVVRSAQAVIAVDGGFGTLSEIAYAVSLDIPVIGLGTWNFHNQSYDDSAVIRADSPTDAVEKALAAAKDLS
ncbi:MAG: hypothetical protein HW403_126 [Dehalococcoidia bacterium]|nr:hypothetical protein [Dehalococcoidia bacterium]